MYGRKWVDERSQRWGCYPGVLASIALDASMIGRRGGTVVADDVLRRLEPFLLKNRVVVSKNADRMLAGRAASGIFRVFKDGSATIFLRSDRTRYELVHELRHYGHFRTIGADSFRRLTRLEQEQFVYDALRRSRHWSGFTAAEIQHAQEYLRSLGGNAW